MFIDSPQGQQLFRARGHYQTQLDPQHSPETRDQANMQTAHCSKKPNDKGEKERNSTSLNLKRNYFGLTSSSNNSKYSLYIFLSASTNAKS